MATKIKRLVSKKKRRFQEDGFDLDLSYITPRLIAMGFPADSFEGVYRNRMKDVKRFFLSRHENHYKVYNLCSERSYSPNHFKNATASFPFDDHNPCSFTLLVNFCENALDYLESDQENIIAVHCKAGKGRTGLLLCCYLQFDKSCASADEAIEFYAERRTKNSKGVTIPSQLRWVSYFGDYCHNYRWAEPAVDFNFEGAPIRMTGFEFKGGCTFEGAFSQPYIKVTRMNKSVIYNGKVHAKSTDTPLAKYNKNQRKFVLDCDICIRGDVHVVFYDAAARDKKMFGFWIHSSFLKFEDEEDDSDGEDGDDDGPIQLLENPGHKLAFTKWELDGACKDKKNRKWAEDFRVLLNYLEDTGAGEVADWVDGSDDEEGSDEDNKRKKKNKKNVHTGARGGALFRQLVSKKKLRFQKDGFDLDLSYITGNIIAMGFPSVSLEGMYRNKMSDVKRFFKCYHDGHYKVYNLCSERNYTPDHFENNVATYPFDDHNPPAFKMLAAFADDAATFMNRSEQNVVSVHCKAGKGRTGTTIAALLLLIGLQPTADQALCFYGSKRTSNIKGVTIPSQQRWVHYFEEYLLNYRALEKPFPFSGVPIQLCGFYLAPICNFDLGGGCDPFFRISLINRTVIHDSRKAAGGKVREWRKPTDQFIIQSKVEVCGDIHVVFYDKDKLGGETKMFGFWFNTAFVHTKAITFKKEDLDTACKDKKCQHFPKDFICQVFFDKIPEAETQPARRATHVGTDDIELPRPSLKLPKAFKGSRPPPGTKLGSDLPALPPMGGVDESEPVDEDEEAQIVDEDEGDEGEEYDSDYSDEELSSSDEDVSDDEFLMRAPGSGGIEEDPLPPLPDMPEIPALPSVPAHSMFPAAVGGGLSSSDDDDDEIELKSNLSKSPSMKKVRAAKAPKPARPIQIIRPKRQAQTPRKKPPPRKPKAESSSDSGSDSDCSGSSSAAEQDDDLPPPPPPEKDFKPKKAKKLTNQEKKARTQSHRRFDWVELIVQWGIEKKKAKSYALKMKMEGYDQFDIDPAIITRESLREVGIAGAHLSRMCAGIAQYRSGRGKIGVTTRPPPAPKRRPPLSPKRRLSKKPIKVKPAYESDSDPGPPPPPPGSGSD